MQQLAAGKEYTLFIVTSRFFEYRSDADIEAELRDNLRNAAQVLYLNRPLLTKEHVVRIKPFENSEFSEWENLIKKVYMTMGYSSANIERIEEGAQTSNFGKEWLKQIMNALSPIMNALSPLLSVAGVIIGVLAVMMLYLFFKSRSKEASA